MKVYNGDLSIDTEQLVRRLDVFIQWLSVIQKSNVVNVSDKKRVHWRILEEIWIMDQVPLLMEQNTFHLLIVILSMALIRLE